ncbi:hypothetical protein J5X84_33490 [Streptosporangiaceae bacterium NEAU-GS5]|nr:hypothetical protein [Streptosporangiaceae bacterium NEAU-GS5]
MIDHGIEFPQYRLHLVPAVLALACPSWQREIWLNPDEFENLDYVVRVLFDDFCDASAPQSWLGVSLRTDEEVSLMATLGAGAAAPDEAYLESPGWQAVLAAAARLAQVVVMNDLVALSGLHDSGHNWPLTNRIGDS